MKVDFWFDAGCPWTWGTSRWLAEVAAARGDEVRWRPYSLAVKNGLFSDDPPDIPEQYVESAKAGHAWLRVVAKLAEDDTERAGERPGDNAGVGRLYTELGRRVHHDEVNAADVDLAEALEAAGFDRGLAACADDESLDASIQASMDEATALVGDDVGVPIIAVDGSGVSGPVVSPVPTGDEALRLYDAVLTGLSTPGFFELKRTRDVPPALPARP